MKLLRIGRGNIDHEEIRRVGRQARAPVLEQVVPHDGEQEQHHQAEPECDHLHDALAPAAREVRDPVAPGDSDRAAQSAGQAHEQEAGAVKHGERHCDAAGNVSDELGSRTIQKHHAEECRDREA